MKDLIKRARKLAKPFRVTDGGFRLKDIDPAEQKKRFLERIEEPEKNWKFSPADAKEREHWDEYMDAYQDMIRNTATKAAPWYVVPADSSRSSNIRHIENSPGGLESMIRGRRQSNSFVSSVATDGGRTCYWTKVQ